MSAPPSQTPSEEPAIDDRNADNAVRRLQLWHLALPVQSARDHGSGRVAGEVEVVILRLETAAGIVGWGEASPWAVFTGTAEASMAALHRYLAPHVLGRDVRDIAAIMTAADRALVGHPEAKAALETALLDATGQLYGVPMWALLGGRCRQRIPLSVSLADPDFDADLALTERIFNDGVRIVKLKTGVKDPHFDLHRLEQLRARFGDDLRLRIDYNQGLEPFDAVRRLREVEQFQPDFIEQPVPGEERAALATIRSALDTPILADESVFNAHQAFIAGRDQICDAVSVKIMKAGGPRRGQQLAIAAAAAGLPGYGGDMFETGIAHLAGVHMIAATPSISLGCEFYQAKYYLQQDLLQTPFPIVGGEVLVPDAPGLGVAVDQSLVEYHARHSAETSA